MSVYVITHKDWRESIELPSCYKWLHVGDSNDTPGDSDCDFFDEDKNSISYLNDSFCELTGLFWIWKNVDESYKGLCHYRRFFGSSALSTNPSSFLREDKILSVVKNNRCIVAKRRYTKLSCMRESYETGHVKSDLDEIERIITEMAPEYIDAFKESMDSIYFYPYNMLIASSELFDEYCSWLFPLLFELNRRIDLSSRINYQKRAFGFLSERLLRVWLEANNIDTVEFPVATPTYSFKGRLKLFAEDVFGCRL